MVALSQTRVFQGTPTIQLVGGKAANHTPKERMAQGTKLQSFGEAQKMTTKHNAHNYLFGINLNEHNPF